MQKQPALPQIDGRGTLASAPAPTMKACADRIATEALKTFRQPRSLLVHVVAKTTVSGFGFSPQTGAT
jgi:hypothetical protein